MTNEIVNITVSMERGWGTTGLGQEPPKVFENLLSFQVSNVDDAKKMMELFFDILGQLKGTNPGWNIL